jgi:hypothetical protein
MCASHCSTSARPNKLSISCQDCIGAIEGTHVTTRVPRSESHAYRERKHYTSQNVLANVDFYMRFTFFR